VDHSAGSAGLEGFFVHFGRARLDAVPTLWRRTWHLQTWHANIDCWRLARLFCPAYRRIPSRSASPDGVGGFVTGSLPPGGAG